MHRSAPGTDICSGGHTAPILLSESVPFAAERPLPFEREKMDFNTLPSFNLNLSVLQQKKWSGLGRDHGDQKSSLLVQKTGRTRLPEGATQPSRDRNPRLSARESSHSAWAWPCGGHERRVLRAAAGTGLEGPTSALWKEIRNARSVENVPAGACSSIQSLDSSSWSTDHRQMSL